MHSRKGKVEIIKKTYQNLLGNCKKTIDDIKREFHTFNGNYPWLAADSVKHKPELG